MEEVRGEENDGELSTINIPDPVLSVLSTIDHTSNMLLYAAQTDIYFLLPVTKSRKNEK